MRSPRRASAALPAVFGPAPRGSLSVSRSFSPRRSRTCRRARFCYFVFIVVTSCVIMCYLVVVFVVWWLIVLLFFLGPADALSWRAIGPTGTAAGCGDSVSGVGKSSPDDESAVPTSLSVAMPKRMSCCLDVHQCRPCCSMMTQVAWVLWR